MNFAWFYNYNGTKRRINYKQSVLNLLRLKNRNVRENKWEDWKTSICFLELRNKRIHETFKKNWYKFLKVLRYQL